MFKNEVTNTIINDMIPYLTGEQLEKLKMSIVRNLYQYDIIKAVTDLTTNVDDNDYYVEKFKREKRVENLAESTINQYVRETHKLFDFVNKNFRDITYDDIIYYFSEISRESKNISRRYLDTKRKHMMAFFKWCYENEFIKKNPFLRVKKIRYEEPKKEVLSSKEIVMIRDACKDKRERAIIDLLLSTGIRVSECSRLNISDIDFSTGEVQIYGKKTRKWRTVYLDANAIKHIVEYLDERTDISDAVFVNNRAPYKRMSTGSIERVTKLVGTRGEVKKKCTVHMFRRTLATRLYRKGMPLKDIANLLGHTVDTLEKYYLIMSTSDVKYIYNRCVA